MRIALPYDGVYRRPASPKLTTLFCDDRSKPTGLFTTSKRRPFDRAQASILCVGGGYISSRSIRPAKTTRILRSYPNPPEISLIRPPHVLARSAAGYSGGGGRKRPGTGTATRGPLATYCA
jgi:hypothetical protein